MENINHMLTQWAVFGGFIVGLWNLWKGVNEWVLQGRQKRADLFLKKQAEFFANEKFNQIRYLIEIEITEPEAAEAVRDLHIEDKRAYVTFFKEIALLKNSKLINPAMATYMFGYYAVRCHACNAFWENMDRNDAFWGVFNAFVFQCEERVNNLVPINQSEAVF